MKTKPVVLLDIKFFEKFSQVLAKSFLQINHHNYIMFLYTLLFKKAEVYANIDVEIIVECVQSKRFDLISLFLKEISQGNGRINSLSNDFDFVKIKTEILNDLNPNFILADISSLEAIEINNQTGIIVLPSEFDNLNFSMQSLVDSISSVSIELFEPFNSFNHYIKKDLFDRLFKSKTIYIEDPFLNKVDINYLVNFIQYMFPTNYMCEIVKVYLVYKDANISSIIEFSDAFEKHFKLVSQKYKYKISISFINNKSDLRMHDRNILTNSFWISNTNSFHANNPSLSNMFVIPIGIYYDNYYARHKSVKGIIDMSKEKQSCITLTFNAKH